MQTKRGTRLLTAGWWGIARHIDYFGRWFQALPFSLRTGLAGYIIFPVGSVVAYASQAAVPMLDGRVAVQGPATGWGTIFTYFYVLYFGILLIHRECRDGCYVREEVWGRLEGVQADGPMENRAVGLLSTCICILAQQPPQSSVEGHCESP